jgi:putative addiction module killer protein
MIEVLKTDEFDEWLSGLADQKAQAKIVSRIERLSLGNPGDVKPVGSGVSEMRVPHGPGYRVYFKQTGRTILLLLCGGDKSTQERDIKRAKEIAAELRRKANGEDFKIRCSGLSQNPGSYRNLPNRSVRNGRRSLHICRY